MAEVAPEQTSRAPSAALTYVLLGLLCLVWGSTWLVIKIGLHHVPPFTGAAARFVLAGACMLLVAHLFAAREGGVRPPFYVSLAHGVCQFAFNFGIVYVAETVIPSGMVAVLWAVFPLFVVIGERLFFRGAPLPASKWLGMAVSLAGVVLLFATDLAAVDARAVPMGLLVLLAPLSVTASTLLIKHRAASASSLLLNRDAMWIGALLLGIAAFVLESPAQVIWTRTALFSIVYLALIGTVVTFGIYMWLLRFVPAYRMSLTSFMIPVVALVLGASVGGEPLSLRTLLGTALVLVGVAFAMRSA